MKIVVENKKAKHLYQIVDTLEAGIELKGTEVQSLRNRAVNLVDSFCRVQGGEMYIYHLHIAPYSYGNLYNHDPERPRRLLLHRREIDRWRGLSEERGFTIVPLRIYFNDRGKAKVEIALVKPKKLYDRRREIQKRDQERELQKLLKLK